jgi:hypothetical protein
MGALTAGQRARAEAAMPSRLAALRRLREARAAGADRDDVLQEAALAVCLAARLYAGEEADFPRFAARCALNRVATLALSGARSRRRERAVARPARVAPRPDLELDVRAALAGLPEAARLAALSGARGGELAAAWGCHKATALRRLRAALAALRPEAA